MVRGVKQIGVSPLHFALRRRHPIVFTPRTIKSARGVSAGDTMKKVPAQFYTTSVRLNHPVAIEPEGGGAASDGNGNWETMGWGCKF
jgi:hypothetical protein